MSTLALTGATTDAAISTMISDVDEAIGLMTTAASNLGAAKSRMDIQSEFVSNLKICGVQPQVDI